MRKFLIFFLFSVLTAKTPNIAEFYFYSGGKRTNLIPCKDVISLIWRRSCNTTDREKILSNIRVIGKWDIKHKWNRISVVKIDTTQGIFAEMLSRRLLTYPEIEFASPLLCSEEGDTLIFTNEIIISLEEHSLNVVDLERMFRISVIWKDPYDTSCVVLKVPKESQLNGIEIAKRLIKENLVKWACPNFMQKINLHKVPNDEYFDLQWVLPKINAPSAWDYETGSPEIIVAVFDQGVDLSHPDLAAITVPGYDVIDNDNIPQPDPQDAHGTCCAGIIAAITNNNGEGVSGVAGGWGSTGGCKIMPIRLFSSEYPSPSWSEVKYCFEWAADHGAKIISNSWSYKTTAQIYPIHEGMEYAVEHGCIILFSAGNEADDEIPYPPNDSLCIAVGATNRYDNRWEYSNYGDSLDITAPSSALNLKGDIWTTDNVGNTGYYPNQCNNGSPDGDYMGNFGGTSAACPYAAGVAALIWSKWPDIPNELVRHILEMTADDLGEPGWDKYYGWGRVNAYRSLDIPKFYTEGPIHITPVLMDIDRDGKQEVFLACDDGDDDGYGMAYAYDSDWNLLQANAENEPRIDKIDTENDTNSRCWKIGVLMGILRSLPFSNPTISDYSLYGEASIGYSFQNLKLAGTINFYPEMLSGLPHPISVERHLKVWETSLSVGYKTFFFWNLSFSVYTGLLLAWGKYWSRYINEEIHTSCYPRLSGLLGIEISEKFYKNLTGVVKIGIRYYDLKDSNDRLFKIRGISSGLGVIYNFVSKRGVQS